MDDIQIYWISLGVSNTILFILWCISFQQLCVTFDRKSTRVRILFYNTCCIISNTLFYLQIIHPTLLFGSINITVVANIFEAFLIVTCYHIFRSLSISIINALYMNAYNKPHPKWVNIFHDITEIFILTMVPICYFCRYIFNTIKWIHICYVIVSFIVLLHGISNLYIIIDILKILNAAGNHSPINSGKYWFKLAIFVTICICIVSIVWIIICIENITNQYVLVTFDQLLMQCIMHSFLYISLTAALLIWYYNKKRHIEVNSICAVLVCKKIKYESPRSYQLFQSPTAIKSRRFGIFQTIFNTNSNQTEIEQLEIEETTTMKTNSEGIPVVKNTVTSFNENDNGVNGELSLILPDVNVDNNVNVIGNIMLTDKQRELINNNIIPANNEFDGDNARDIQNNSVEDISVDVHVHDTYRKNTNSLETVSSHMNANITEDIL